MQISKALKRSKRGSLHFGRRLSIVLLVALLMVAIALVAFRGFAEFSVAGNPDSPGTPVDSKGHIDSSTGTSSSSNDEGDYNLIFGSSDSNPTPTPTATPVPGEDPEPVPIPFDPDPTPEFGFGGAAIALVICFIAFGLFTKRGSLKAKHA